MNLTSPNARNEPLSHVAVLAGKTGGGLPLGDDWKTMTSMNRSPAIILWGQSWNLEATAPLPLPLNNRTATVLSVDGRWCNAKIQLLGLLLDAQFINQKKKT